MEGHMNNDRMTTILGLVVAAITAVMTFQAPPETPMWQLVLGYVAAVSAALWGYLTNKR